MSPNILTWQKEKELLVSLRHEDAENPRIAETASEYMKRILKFGNKMKSRRTGNCNLDGDSVYIDMAVPLQ